MDLCCPARRIVLNISFSTFTLFCSRVTLKTFGPSRPCALCSRVSLMKLGTLFLLALVLFGSPLLAQDSDRMLFTFDDHDGADEWQTVNDGVMGGRSDGRIKINQDGQLEFFGKLSLENNGGFASVRARGIRLDVNSGDSIVARVRGDGREYNFNLYMPRSIGRYSYRQSFTTEKDKWIEVSLPVDKFVATWRGRVFPNEKFDPRRVTGIGFLLGDKKAGPFKLEVDWIQVRGHSTAAAMNVHRDIAYVENGDPRQKLDIYSPGDGSGRAIVVWIHGGGWRKGDKTAVHRKPQAFVAKGYVFVSVNYRFVPEVSVSEMTADIAKAIKWVRDHADEHGGSSGPVFVMGHSAGAHLAALVCTDDRYLKAEGLSLADITGCTPVDTAAYDVSSQINSIGPLRNETYTSVFGEDLASQKELSPISYVADGEGIPSFLILHVADRLDSTARSRAFADALNQAGVDCEVFAAEGKDHGTINRDLGLPEDPPTKALFEFMKGLL